MNRRFNIILNFFIKNNQFRTFLLFFVLSGGLWLFSQLSASYIYNFRMPVVYVNLPQGYYKGFLPHDTIQIRVKTTGFQILHNKMTQPELTVDVQKKALIKRKFWYPLNIKGQINTLLGTGSNILAIYPEKLKFEMPSAKRKKIPVVADVTLHFLPGYKNTAQAVLQPDSIWVFGKASVLDTLQNIKTRHYDIRNIGKNVSKWLTIKKIGGLKLNRDKIKYDLPVSEIIEDEMEVPVKVKGTPAGIKVLLFPKSVKLSYKFFKDNKKHIRPDDFDIIVVFNRQEDSWKPQLIKRPEGVFDVEIKPENIKYLIEK